MSARVAGVRAWCADISRRFCPGPAARISPTPSARSVGGQGRIRAKGGKTAAADTGSGHSCFFLFAQRRLTGCQCFLDNTFFFYVFHGCHSQSSCLKACGNISLHPRLLLGIRMFSKYKSVLNLLLLSPQIPLL
jgi:hypothetical protein